MFLLISTYTAVYMWPKIGNLKMCLLCSTRAKLIYLRSDLFRFYTKQVHNSINTFYKKWNFIVILFLSFQSENAFIFQLTNDYDNIFGFHSFVHFGFENKWNGAKKLWIKTSQRGKKFLLLRPWLSMPVTENSSLLFTSCHLELVISEK